MAYTKGGLIQAADYNTLVSQLNGLWGTGTGQRGYGQTSLLAQVSQSSKVTATQWATLVARMTAIRMHQSNTSVPGAPITVGAVVDARDYGTILTEISNDAFFQRSANPGEVGPADLLSSLWNYSPGNFGANRFELIRTITFDTADQARYFFNSGGTVTINFAAEFNRTGTPSPRVNSWLSFIGRALPSITIGGNSFVLPVGNSTTPITNNSGTGYWSLSNSTETQLALIQDNTGSNNNFSISARTNGTQGANGDRGNVITIRVVFNESNTITGDLFLNIRSTATARRASTTFLPTAYPFPDLRVVSYQLVIKSLTTTEVFEESGIPVTVTTTNVPDGTSLAWRVITSSQFPDSPTTAADFVNGVNAGSVVINNNTGTFAVNIAADLLSELTEVFEIELLRNGAVVTSSQSISINDTSNRTTYSITGGRESFFSSTPETTVDESNVYITFRVVANGAVPGTVLYWHVTPGSTASYSDFNVSETSPEKFTIGNDGKASFRVVTRSDRVTEGTESFSVQIRTRPDFNSVVATSNTITINDTSKTPFSFTGTISGNVLNYSLADKLTAAGWNGVQEVDARITVLSGAILGSDGSRVVTIDQIRAAFETLSSDQSRENVKNPQGTLFIDIQSGAYIVGYGAGLGNNGAFSTRSAGDAMKIEFGLTTTIDNRGVIAGGGGAGGTGEQINGTVGGGGGGGAGSQVGLGLPAGPNSSPGQNGTLLSGGAGGAGLNGSNGGRGGNLGKPGQPGIKQGGGSPESVRNPTAAGRAIVGFGVTFINRGTLLGDDYPNN